MTTINLPPNKIAANSDADSKLFIEAFGELEEFSNRYIKEMLKIGGYPAAYPWPVDNLHNWSRWWEYAFVWLNLKRLVAKKKTIRVLDIGSGLTFFPFFLADKGFEVTTIDIDARIKKWAEAALVKQKPGFVTGDVTKTKFNSHSFDVITNISVIEHVDNKVGAIVEMYRLLQPDGMIVNTLDISLDGLPIGDSQPLRVREAHEFIGVLEKTFNTKIAFEFVHPMDILTPAKYPKRFTDGSLYISKRHLMRQLWKLLSSRLSARFVFNPHRLDMWTVMGVTARKKK